MRTTSLFSLFLTFVSLPSHADSPPVATTFPRKFTPGPSNYWTLVDGLHVDNGTISFWIPKYLTHVSLETDGLFADQYASADLTLTVRVGSQRDPTVGWPKDTEIVDTRFDYHPGQVYTSFTRFGTQRRMRTLAHLPYVQVRRPSDPAKIDSMEVSITAECKSRADVVTAHEIFKTIFIHRTPR